MLRPGEPTRLSHAIDKALLREMLELMAEAINDVLYEQRMAARRHKERGLRLVREEGAA